MTRQEASERYRIPVSVLREYEGWALVRGADKVPGAWQYDGGDLDRLSTVLTLRDLGFDSRETETYMRLLERPDSGRQRLRMMEEKRQETWWRSNSASGSSSGWTTSAGSCKRPKPNKKTAPPAQFFAEYLSMMILFAAASHSLGRILLKIKKGSRFHESN